MSEKRIVDHMFDDIVGKIYWYERVWWFVCRKYGDIKYYFKKKYQRLKYGFPLEQSWDFLSWHAEIVVPRLKHLMNNLHGHPSELKSVEEWQMILEQMIWSFEHLHDLVSPIYSDDYDHRLEVEDTPMGGKLYSSLNKTGTIDWSPVENHNKKVQEGLNLFAKYYTHLWD